VSGVLMTTPLYLIRLSPAHTKVHHTTRNKVAIILLLSLPILPPETFHVYLLPLLSSLLSSIMGKYTLNISCNILISFLRSSFSMHLSRYKSPHFTVFSTPYHLCSLDIPLSYQILFVILVKMDLVQVMSSTHH